MKIDNIADYIVVTCETGVVIISISQGDAKVFDASVGCSDFVSNFLVVRDVSIE